MRHDFQFFVQEFKNLEIPGPDLRRGEGGRRKEERGGEKKGGEGREDSLLSDPQLHVGTSV